MYCAPNKCFLSIFCELQNWKSVIDPIFSWSDLFSKLEKIRTFILQLSKKCSKSNFLEQNTNFFCKCSLLGSQTFLSFWAIPNMLGHPVNKNMFCTNFKMRFDSLLKNVFHFNYIIPGNLFCLFFCWQKRERDCFECKRELLLLLKSFHAKWILLWRRCSCMSFIFSLGVWKSERCVVAQFLLLLRFSDGMRSRRTSPWKGEREKEQNFSKKERDRQTN